MKIFSGIKNLLSKIPLKKRFIFIGLLVVIAVAGVWFFKFRKTDKQLSYQTTKAQKGTLITSISGTGTITTGNTTRITTGVTGTITTVYVKNGDVVAKGDKIAKVSLDDYGLKRQAAAWVGYTNALESVKTYQKNKTATDIEMWDARQAIIDAEDDIKYKNENPIDPDTNKEWNLTIRTELSKTLQKAKEAFNEAELKYKNYDAEVQNAQIKVISSWYDYQQVSSTIVAPTPGTIQNLMLAEGTVISNDSDSSISIDDGTSGSLSSNNKLTATAKKVGAIKSAEGQYQATISMTEIDVTTIKADQKVTITMDAFPDKTFTGKVLGVDTSGSISSGVTTYSVIVILDATSIDIYPNMAVTADIITNIKKDVVLVPSISVQTADNKSVVRVMKDKKVSTVMIETGLSNDSQTEIISGISEGDEIITDAGTTASTTTDSKTTKSSNGSSISPFSGMGGMGGGGRPPGQ